MPSSAVYNPTDLLATPVSLGQLLDSRGLEEILASFYGLFRISVRVLDEHGDTVARSRKPTPLNEYLGELPQAGQLLRAFHARLRRQDLGERGEHSETAFSGATYHVGGIGHEGRSIGRFILGPFITPLISAAPATLLEAEPRVDLQRASELLLALPRVRPDTVKAIARHLAVTLQVSVHAGYRAWLSEHMHLSTVQENERQLSAKNEGLLAAEQRLLESTRLQAHFLATALGEIRGPLESIVGDSDALAAAGHGPGPGDAALAIRRRAAQLRELSGRLLDFSKVESGALSLCRESIDVRGLLSRVASRLAALAPGRARDLVVEGDAAPSSLWGDAACIEQVLLLLGDNALRFAPEGPIAIGARRAAPADLDDADGLVLLGAPPERLELWVSDRGIGVADADKEHIFQPFYRPARGEVMPGAGSRLSLAIAKRLIAAHGGSIRVEDNPPRGTRVILSLPAAGAGL